LSFESLSAGAAFSRIFELWIGGPNPLLLLLVSSSKACSSGVYVLLMNFNITLAQFLLPFRDFGIEDGCSLSIKDWTGVERAQRGTLQQQQQQEEEARVHHGLKP
jgi:hypothetical protein